MSDIHPVLSLIDGAIEDYISNDAMRWTPEPASEPGAHMTDGEIAGSVARICAVLADMASAEHWDPVGCACGWPGVQR